MDAVNLSGEKIKKKEKKKERKRKKEKNVLYVEKVRYEEVDRKKERIKMCCM